MRLSPFALATLAACSVGTVAWAAPPHEPPQDIVCRGASAEGFSYHWAGTCWCRSDCAPDDSSCSLGLCTATAPDGCPDHCYHTGTYGADCSGFVQKAWQVPDPVPVETCGTWLYGAAAFTQDHQYWDVIPLNDMQPGDAAARNGHVVLIVGDRDSYGEYEIVEAQSCVAGIIRRSRSFGSEYNGARRINIDCCSEGAQQTESCGDCGSRSQSCSNCVWSAWSACEGPDPTGSEADCSVASGTGVCATGQLFCVAGYLTCEPHTASMEICDGLDNDCDGATDEDGVCGSGGSPPAGGTGPGGTGPGGTGPGGGAEPAGGTGPGGGAEPAGGLTADDRAPTWVSGCACRTSSSRRGAWSGWLAMATVGVIALRRRSGCR